MDLVKKLVHVILVVCISTQVESSACNSTILSADFHRDDYFNESSFRTSYAGKFLVFTLPFAWCPETSKYSSLSQAGYKEWIVIDLQMDYRVTALRAGGYKTVVDAKENKYMIRSFFIEYKASNGKSIRYKEGNAAKIFIPQKILTATALQTPFVARFIKVWVFIKTDASQCLKLQFYGCPATITTVSTLASTTTALKTARTTASPNVSIMSYELYQGNEWDGFKLREHGHTGKLIKVSSGKGVLSNGIIAKSGPRSQPMEWIGWSKDLVNEPFLAFHVQKTEVRDITLIMFIDKKKKIEAFRSITIMYDMKATQMLYACSGAKENELDGVERLALDLGKMEVERLRLDFNYRGNWLMISEVLFNAGLHGATVYKVGPTACSVVKPTGGKDSTSTAIIAGISVAVILLLVILIILFMRRKSMFRRRRLESSRASKNQEMGLIQSMTDNPIYAEGRNGTSPNYTEVSVDDDNHKQQLLKRDEIYAAPDTEFYVSDDPSGYSAIEDISKPRGLKRQDVDYAEPGSPTSPDPDDVEFNPIYEQTYENPYKAVSGSSIYADPDQQTGRKSIQIKKFPRDRLTFIEKIGSGQFGEVIICEIKRLKELLGPDSDYSGPDRAMVAVKTLKSGVDQSIQTEFMKEVRVMARLEHENVVNLLGVCDDEPKCMVVEYMENGDLNQFLKNSKRYDGPEDPRVSQVPRDVLLVNTLMYMVMQIASGMKYLSSHGFIHRDLATRNCLVGHAYTVKISDFGMSRYLYSKQYYRIEGKAVLPIRWMAPESLFYGKFTSFTDVWAFGITVWEVFSYARETPYSNMTDQQVIDNACSFVQERRKLFQYLRQPRDCPGEVYNVMMQCWAKTPQDRPTFDGISSFFSEQVESYEGSI